MDNTALTLHGDQPGQRVKSAIRRGPACSALTDAAVMVSDGSKASVPERCCLSVLHLVHEMVSTMLSRHPDLSARLRFFSDAVMHR
jgi:hypothetical protein